MESALEYIEPTSVDRLTTPSELCPEIIDELEKHHETVDDIIAYFKLKFQITFWTNNYVYEAQFGDKTEVISLERNPLAGSRRLKPQTDEYP